MLEGRKKSQIVLMSVHTVAAHSPTVTTVLTQGALVQKR